eukprot:Filipodium_phascolosomae@DN447_c0_g1_i1.p1
MAPRVNSGYLWSWIIVISLGMFQFGYAIAMFNVLTKILYEQYKKHGNPVVDNKDLFNSIATTMVPVGAVLGAFTGGILCNMGRRVACLIVDVVSIGASMLTLVFNFYALCGGRFLLGWAAGVFTVICPMFVAETSPEHLAGALGAINQFQVCFGIMIACLWGFLVPFEKLKGQTTLNPEALSTQIWRIIFACPAVFSALQIVLLLLVFKHDTPKFYKQKGNIEAADRVNDLIYPDREDEMNKPVLDEEDREEAPVKKVSLAEHFTPRYRMAFFVGIALSLFQQLTGINAVIFYSNDLFTIGKTGYESEAAAKVGTMLVGVVNWASAMAAIPLLARFGRKTLLIFGQIGMGLCLGTLGIFALMDQQTGIKAVTLLFLCFFEFSIGPVMWLYAAEIMTETGMAAASLVNWATTIIFGFCTSPMFKLFTPAGMYFIFAGISVVGLLFEIFCIRETKGLSKEEIANLYVPKELQYQDELVAAAEEEEEYMKSEESI